jgi:hypothetical protein
LGNASLCVFLSETDFSRLRSESWFKTAGELFRNGDPLFPGVSEGTFSIVKQLRSLVTYESMGTLVAAVDKRFFGKSSAAIDYTPPGAGRGDKRLTGHWRGNQQ